MCDSWSAHGCCRSSEYALFVAHLLYCRKIFRALQYGPQLCPLASGQDSQSIDINLFESVVHSQLWTVVIFSFLVSDH